MSSDRFPSLRELLTHVFRIRRVALFCLAVPPAVALVASFLMPPVYEADAKILVKAGREFMPGSDSTHSNGTAPQSTLQQTIQSEIEILTSRDLMLDVLHSPAMSAPNDLGRFASIRQWLRNLFPGDAAKKQENAVVRLRDNISAEPVKLTNVLSVTYRDKNRDAAVQGLKTVLAAYLTRHMQAFSSREAPLIQNEIDRNLETLRALQVKSAALKGRTDVYATDEQRKLLMAQRDKAVADLAESRIKLREDRSLLAYLKAQTRKVPAMKTMSSTTDAAGRSALEAQLLLKRQQLQSLLQSYTENSPMVKQVQAEIAATERFVSDRIESQTIVTTGPNPVDAVIQQQIVTTQGELNVLEPKVAELEKLIDATNANLRQTENEGVEQRNLDMRIANAEMENNGLRDALVQARISEHLNSGQVAAVTVIDEPHALPNPVWPSRLLFVLAGLVVGAFAAGFAVLLSATLRRTFVTAEGLERELGLPVLASLSVLPGRPAPQLGYPAK